MVGQRKGVKKKKSKKSEDKMNEGGDIACTPQSGLPHLLSWKEAL